MSEKTDEEGLSARIQSLEREKFDLEQRCQEQRKAADLLEAIREAQSLYITGADAFHVFKLLLRSLVEMTESEYGFLDEVFYDENGTAFKKNLAISDITWDEPSRLLYSQLQDRDLRFEYLENLSGIPALTGETVISNDPAADPRSGGLPAGHPPIRSFMGMPLFFGGRLICVAGMANREGGYNEEIARFLEPLLSTCAGITYALRKEADEREKEKKLRESEAKYRLIVENQNDLVVQIGPNQRIIFASPSFYRTFGLTKGELAEKPFAQVVQGENGDRESFCSSFQELRKPPHVTYLTAPASTVSGWRWFGWSLKAVFDDQYDILEVIAVGRDITGRIKAEQALKESKQRFQTVADFTYDWEYWIAPDGSYVYVSPSCRRITGYSPEAYISNPRLMEEIIHPEDLPLAREPDGEEVPEPHRADFRIITRWGEERWIGHICQSVYDEGGHFLGKRGSNRDITEQKRMQQQSIKARKMQAIGALAGGVAHEFNNALAAITGNLELLEEDFAGSPAVAKYSGEIKSAADRMRRLTSQLLAYARGGKYQARTLSLNHFVSESLPILLHSVHSDIPVDTSLSDPDMRCRMDPTQIQMVLSEVLANASEAISEKGNIRIRLRRVFVEGKDTEGPDALSPGAYACLAVADNGRGMDEETKNRIFEPFFSTKFQGRGLGMAAAYGIVKNHNGSISVDSRAGAGTTVSIFLPVAEPGPDTKSAPGQQNALVQESGTVLVIEDEPQVREICRKILERLGFRVLEAPTAAEAIRIAQSFEGDIDLVLLDYVMPRMQGNDLYQRLKQCRRNVKVIVTSGYPIDGPVQQVLNAGAQGFIQKPFSRNELSEKVFRILGKKRDVP